jgi:hypothetical protein
MEEFVPLFKRESEADEFILLLQCEREMEANPTDEATHKHILEARDMATTMCCSVAMFYFGYDE